MDWQFPLGGTGSAFCNREDGHDGLRHVCDFCGRFVYICIAAGRVAVNVRLAVVGMHISPAAKPR